VTADAEDRRLRIDGEPVDVEDVAFREVTKRPVTVEAAYMPAPFEVETLEGTMRGEEGDVLIRGVEGEVYPCDAEVFYQTYNQREVPSIEDPGPDWRRWLLRGGGLVMCWATLVVALKLCRWLWLPELDPPEVNR